MTLLIFSYICPIDTQLYVDFKVPKWIEYLESSGRQLVREVKLYEMEMAWFYVSLMVHGVKKLKLVSPSRVAR